MTGLKPFDPGALLLLALLNPIVAYVGFRMGRAASEPQKIVIAGFVASIAGIVCVWIAAYVKLLPARGIGGEGGLFALQFLVGMVWAALGYWFRRRR